MDSFTRLGFLGIGLLLGMAAGCLGSTGRSDPQQLAMLQQQLNQQQLLLREQSEQLQQQAQRLADLQTQALPAEAAPGAATIQPAPAHENAEDNGPEIKPNGFTAELNLKQMKLSGGMHRAALAGDPRRGAAVTSADGRALGSIHLPAGIYRARLFMQTDGNSEHDAVNLVIDGQAPCRVFRFGSGLGSVAELTPRIELPAARDVSVQIEAAETGMTLDKVVFEGQELVKE